MNAIRIALIFSLCYVALSQECREQRSLEETEQLTAERKGPGGGGGRPGGGGGRPGKGKPRPQSTEEAEQLTAEEADNPAGALNWLYKSLRGQ